MLEEEDPPKPQRLAAIALDRMGIDELQGYIVELRAEIDRVMLAVDGKKAHRDAAATLFRR